MFTLLNRAIMLFYVTPLLIKGINLNGVLQTSRVGCVQCSSIS